MSGAAMGAPEGPGETLPKIREPSWNPKPRQVAGGPNARLFHKGQGIQRRQDREAAAARQGYSRWKT